jgi:hypothetical protein
MPINDDTRNRSERSELAVAKASLTGPGLGGATVGENADTVAATARALGVGLHT